MIGLQLFIVQSLFDSMAELLPRKHFTHEMLPIYIDDTTHPYLTRLSQAYRPHTRVPSRQELLENQYDRPPSHCSIKGLTTQCGMNYTEEIKRRG